jgi:hypothetical protein
MELDDFKKKDRQRKDFAKVDDQSSNERIDNMIDTFKSYQKTQRKKAIYIIILNFSLAAIYISNMAFQKGMTALGYFILGMGCIGAVLYLFIRYKPFSAETYSLPLKEFLDRAERKTSYFNSIDYFIIIPLLMFLGTGGGMVFTTRLLRYTDNSTLLIIIWVLFFISLCLFGFWAGKKNWQKEFGDLHTSIKEMKNSFSANGKKMEIRPDQAKD